MRTREELLASGVKQYDIERTLRAQVLFDTALSAVRITMLNAPEYLVHAIAVEDLRRAAGVR